MTMAKHHEEWICEICGRAHNHKHLAEDCEKAHVSPVDIDRSEGWYNGERYPGSVFLRMSDGEVIEYQLAD